jgi:hypothetical protein
MRKYFPTQGDWVEYCKDVLGRDEPLYNSFSSTTKDRREWRNFLAWYRRKAKAN